jgi:hypothetical protein
VKTWLIKLLGALAQDAPSAAQEASVMKWETVREHFPNQWVIMEAFDARSEGGKYIVEDMSVLDAVLNGSDLMRVYRERLCKTPDRSILFFHTKRETLDIEERTSLRRYR